MIQQSQSTQSYKFSISLQYPKKDVGDGVHFLHENKHQSFYKLALPILIEVPKYVQSTQNRILVIFLQYVNNRNVLQILFCSIVMQKLRYFLNVQSSLLLLVWFYIPGQKCLECLIFEA